MKKFKFSLETVLAYKDQVLDSLQTEHAVIQAKVRQQQEVVDQLEQQYRFYNEEYRAKKLEGMTIMDAMGYQRGLRALEDEIKGETKRLEQLKAEEEKKRAEVVAAKVETASLEKLKGKKLTAYQKDALKDEERFVDEFVNSVRSTTAASA